MSGLVSRFWEAFTGVWDNTVGVGVDAIEDVVRADELAYKHMLWQMREEAGSDTDAWAGQAQSARLAEKYATVSDLLDDKAKLARYRDPDNGEGPIFWACF